MGGKGAGSLGGGPSDWVCLFAICYIVIETAHKAAPGVPSAVILTAPPLWESS